MLNIQEIKSYFLSNLDSYITNQTKAQAMTAIRTEVMPAVAEVAAAVSTKLKEQAEGAPFWVSVRDKYFFPAVISVGIYVANKVVDKMAEASV